MSSAWGKRMSSAWGKRMSSAWGKRAESDSDELKDRILRELYHQARFSTYDFPRYPFDNEGEYLFFDIDERLQYRCLVYEQYLAQQTAPNNDEEAMPRHMS